MQVLAFRSHLLPRRGPWRNVEAVEFATLEWVDWLNNRHLLEPIGNVPPAEFEQEYYCSHESHAIILDAARAARRFRAKMVRRGGVLLTYCVAGYRMVEKNTYEELAVFQ
jgi:hypothetical protein